MANLILPREYDRVAHVLKCEVVVPAGAGAAEVSAVVMGIKERFVADMHAQGFEYTGEPMRLLGPRPYIEPLDLLAPPPERKYRPGEPRPNREAEVRAGEERTRDVPDLGAADAWSFTLQGRFHAAPILVESE